MTKDRYTNALIVMLLGIAISFYLFRTGMNKYASIIGMLSVVPFFYTMTRSGRLHHSENDRKRLIINYLGENGCGFNRKKQEKLDGVRIKGIRYKLVNGTDYKLSNKGILKPCGIGSHLMEYIGGGGAEPESIQENPCWK